MPVRVIGLQAGWRPTVVFERLGRASIGITLGVFSQVMTGIQEEAALSL